MKAPAFQFYAADYLADEAVSLMSLEAEGAYIRLLAFCWREGTIPANPGQLSRLCKGASPGAIEEILPCFYPDPTQPGRLLHKRLEAEREKQEQHRLKQAENGRRGGRPPKPIDNPTETQNKAVGYFGETQTEPKKSSTSSTTSTNNDPIPSGAAPRGVEDAKAEIEGMQVGGKGLDLTEKERKFLDLFNQICKRKFETLPEKAKRQLLKLRKKMFTVEDFIKSLTNGHKDSLKWRDPSKYTPEYATREAEFEKYLYAESKTPSPVFIPERPMTEEEYKALWT